MRESVGEGKSSSGKDFLKSRVSEGKSSSKKKLKTKTQTGKELVRTLFLHCTWHWRGAGGGVADGVFEEFSHKMRFERQQMHEGKHMFVHTRCVHERRWSTSAVRRVPDGLVCGQIMFGSWADMVGSVPHCTWTVNVFSSMCGRQNSIVICNCKIVPAL